MNSSVIFSTNSTITLAPFLTTYLFNLSSFPQSPNPIHHHRRRRRWRRIESHFVFNCLHNSVPLNPRKAATTVGLLSSQQQDDKFPLSDVLSYIAKPVAFTILLIVLGFHGLSQKPANAAPVASEVLEKNIKEGYLGLSYLETHEFSVYSKSLLQTVSGLLLTMQKVKLGSESVRRLKMALGKVKLKKEALQEQIMCELRKELRALREKKGDLVKESEQVFESAFKFKEKRDALRKEGGKTEAKERELAKLENMICDNERKYEMIMERIDEIEDQMLRRETITLSIGVRELCSIERECRLLVEDFIREKNRRNIASVPKIPVTKLSRSEIQKELLTAERQFWEQRIVSNIIGDEGAENEDILLLLQQDSMKLAQRIQKAIAESREMQKNLEFDIRKNMKKFNLERHVILNNPVNEILKGFPKAEDVDLGEKYVSQRKERILSDRDRVSLKTWYNEENKRWEMDPIAVPYAVSTKLVESARIRHDWAAMYVALKGDDKEYYVNIKEFEMLFEDFGGFDGLYLKMLASGVPTAVQFMWIPFSKLDFPQQFRLITSLARQLFVLFWRSVPVLYMRKLVFGFFRDLITDIEALRFDFQMMDSFIPCWLKVRLGMRSPDGAEEESMSSLWHLQEQYDWQNSFVSQERSFFWYVWFLIRLSICGYVLFHVYLFLKRGVPRYIGFGPLQRNPNMWKLRKMRKLFRIKSRLERTRERTRGDLDPITTAFDQMKRVKKPPIHLKDFASAESMKEEINEVVAFLQNPSAFQEMGARPPRGVLIVGGKGTGKTSLAMAIAAEAKVPVVEVKAQQLEANLWIGQGASNVRELFQTARDLAPVIIFVEDFETFAGVRGKFIHTEKQDHEAFINQLLVELDGFEKQDGVVLMATTQNLKQIDAALQRPGRMDRIFHLQPPTEEEREKILRIAAKETMDPELIGFVDWRKVAEKTAFLRPVELRLVPMALEGSAFRTKFLDADELLSYTSLFATFSNFIPTWMRKTKIGNAMGKMLVNHLGLSLTREDFQNVVDLMEPYGQITNGIDLMSPRVDWTRETKFPHAVWAAGRGLIAALLPNFDMVDNLWLEPSAWEGIGCTKITKARTESCMTGNVESRSYLEKKLVFCFGSYVASQLLLPFGEENMLSSFELKQAQEVATRMVIQYGWRPDDSPIIYSHGNADTVTTLSMGDSHEYKLAAEVEKMHDLGYDKAKEILRRNQHVLSKIVEELIEHEVLTWKDVQRIIADNGGTREKEPFSLLKSNNQEPVFGSLLAE